MTARLDGAVPLCRMSELGDGEGRPIALSVEGRELTLLLVRKGQQVFAYSDRCPHMGISLLWDRKLLVTPDGSYLRCANHDALFRIRDGVCVAGPCIDERLEVVVTRVAGEGFAVRNPLATHGDDAGLVRARQ